MKQRAEAPPSPLPDPTGIVSVNNRGGTSTGIAAKMAFALLLVGLLFVGALLGYNRFQNSRNGNGSAISSPHDTARPTHPRPRKVFAPEPAAALPSVAAQPVSATVSPCPDGEPAQLLTGPGGHPIPDSAGIPLQVCKGGQLVLSPNEPMLGKSGTSIAATTPGVPPSPAVIKPTRFGGDVALSNAGLPPASPVAPNGIQDAAHYPQIVQLQQKNLGHASAGNEERTMAPAGGNLNQHGELGPLLAGSRSSSASATLIGDRDMVVPQGRSIDCNLSMRLITEVSGKATCVLSMNVYSDSGRVVLAERGSTVTGEYTALMAQGQRRIFVLWTRLQTPAGVVIDIASPAADALGTSGLPGDVDNRWRERIGAAVLLSLVEDAIGYQTAKASTSGAANGAQGIAILENSTRTGRSLAERILDSTINIKPTVFKRQGDRATIFVSRDLDFGGVYALRAK